MPWPKEEMPERMPEAPSSQMPPSESVREPGLPARVEEPRRERLAHHVDAGRAEQVGRRGEERAAARAVVLVEGERELAAQRGAAARLRHERSGRRGEHGLRGLVDGADARRVAARAAAEACESVARLPQPLREPAGEYRIAFEPAAHHEQRVPRALLDHRGLEPALA